MKETFVFYKEWKEALQELPPDERCAVYEAIIDYATTGETCELSQLAKLAFGFIKRILDRDNQKWEDLRRKRSEAGKKHSGNQYAKTEQDGTNGTNGTSVPKMEQDGTNGTVHVHDNVHVHVNNIIDDDDDDARESNFSEKIKIEELHKKLLPIYSEATETTNAIRQKIYHEQNRLLQTQTIAKYFEDFVQKTKAEGTTEMCRKDFQKNFAYWLYKRIEMETQSRQSLKNKKNNGPEREKIAGADEFTERL